MSAARPLYPWRWLGLPMVQTLGAVILFGIPFRLWGFQLPEPIFPMAAVFAWAVIRPSVLAPLGVLIMGLALDLYWGGAMGVWAISMLLAYGVVLGGRSMLAGQSRVVLWSWYAAATGLAMICAYLLVMLGDQAMPSLVAMGWQFLATIVLYPFADRLIETFEDADVRFR